MNIQRLRIENILSLALFVTLATGSAKADYFTNAAPMSTTRTSQAAVLLPNGNAMMMGGINSNAIATNGTEAYNCTTGTWSTTASMNIARGYHTATLLPSGKVLVAGGLNVFFSLYATNAELYDPSANTWTITGALITPRYFDTATMLGNGKVLVAGGEPLGSGTITNTELYDPATGIWTATGSMANAHVNHTATLLPSGKVLVVGSTGSTMASVEIYDPVSGTWSAGPSLQTLTTARGYHTATLPNGNVLVAGGTGNSGFLTSCILYTNGTWVNTGNLNVARAVHTATLLPSGKVLVVGGENSTNYYLSSAELYDPASGTWTLTAPTVYAQQNPQAVLLPNGQFLLAGGTLPGGLYGNNVTSNAQLYVTTAATVPLILNNPVLGAGGSLTFTFTNTPRTSFTILAATNVSLPTSNWTVLGTATEISSGQYQFTDSSAAANTQRFYRARSP